MKWKIGRFWYKEITEKEYCDKFDDKNMDIATLIDYYGDPIKYFKKCRKTNKEVKLK